MSQTPAASPLPPSPNSPSSETPAGIPTAPAGTLTLNLQADTSLAGFATVAEPLLTLCLGQIASASTRLSLPSGMPEAALNALRSSGATVATANGQTTATLSQNLSLKDLLAGIEFKLKGVPGGTIEGRTTFFNTAGAELGFVSWQAELRGSSSQVSVTLKASSETKPGDACPRLAADVNGGTILGAGGQVVNPNPLPNPITTPSPTATASPAGSAQSQPTGLQIVEQTSSSLTLQWEFGSGPLSYKLYLDGQQVASNHTSPNYYRFEGLNSSTTYRLGVQAVNASGQSEIASLSTATLASGSNASGNFSGGGGGGSSSRPSASPSPSPSASPVGEFRVNSYTTELQGNPAVAVDADGDFIVTWHDFTQDGSDHGIFGQRYTSAGVAQGSEFQVNTYTTAAQRNPAVAMDADGDFVVIWESAYQDGDLYEIFGQRYTSAGIAQGSEFHVNTYTTARDQEPAVAMDADGDFVVTWHNDGEDGSSYGIFGQRYSSAGVAQGSEFQVNTYTTAAQRNPAVAMDTDGDFVITWVSAGEDGDNYGIFGQRYTSAGVARGSEFPVNTYTTTLELAPAVAMEANGDFVITWSSDGQDGDSYGIFGQRYTSAGVGQGSEFQVNTYTTSAQRDPSVAMDADGDFVVTWFSIGQDGSSNGIFGQRYTSAGVAQGSEFRVNTYTTNNQRNPAVAMDADGDFVVIWRSFEQDGNSYGIFGQLYAADGTAR
ncbi:MAG: fibronectin type III domain-containing protein [Candidatus Sericytochromatia bacterium]